MNLGQLSQRIRSIVSLLWRCELRLRGVKLGVAVIVNGRPIITRDVNARITMGSRVTLNSSPRCNPLGNTQPCVIRALCSAAKIVLSDDVGVSGATICAASEVKIGEGTIIGRGAMITDTDFHNAVDEWSWDSDAAACASPVAIGRGVFIGAGAIILKGVNIGDRAVVGAGAVVTNDVPERAIVAGNPATIVKEGWV